MNATNNFLFASVLSALKELSRDDVSVVCVEDVQVLLYHVANALFLLSFASPNTRYGQVRSFKLSRDT